MTYSVETVNFKIQVQQPVKDEFYRINLKKSIACDLAQFNKKIVELIPEIGERSFYIIWTDLGGEKLTLHSNQDLESVLNNTHGSLCKYEHQITRAALFKLNKFDYFTL